MFVPMCSVLSARMETMIASLTLTRSVMTHIEPASPAQLPSAAVGHGHAKLPLNAARPVLQSTCLARVAPVFHTSLLGPAARRSRSTATISC